MTDYISIVMIIIAVASAAANILVVISYISTDIFYSGGSCSADRASVGILEGFIS